MILDIVSRARKGASSVRGTLNLAALRRGLVQQPPIRSCDGVTVRNGGVAGTLCDDKSFSYT
jgi:hypothetical protein